MPLLVILPVSDYSEKYVEIRRVHCDDSKSVTLVVEQVKDAIKKLGQGTVNSRKRK